MSNHFHVVLRNDPFRPWDWTDREVAERWLAIFQGSISNRDSRDQPLKPVAGLDTDDLSDMTETSYIELVRWTGLQAHPEKSGKLSAAEESPPEGPWNVAHHLREWIRRVQGTESRYYREIGYAEALMRKAADLGQQHRQWSSCGLRDTRKKRVRNAVMRG